MIHCRCGGCVRDKRTAREAEQKGIILGTGEGTTDYVQFSDKTIHWIDIADIKFGRVEVLAATGQSSMPSGFGPELDHYTALYFAYMRSNTRVFDLLVEKKAKPTYRVKLSDTSWKDMNLEDVVPAPNAEQNKMRESVIQTEAIPKNKNVKKNGIKNKMVWLAGIGVTGIGFQIMKVENHNHIHF